MPHIKIRSIHTSPDEPVLTFTELDDSRHELRKVEIFWDGSTGYASADARHKDTQLYPEPVPDLLGLAENPESVPEDISAEDFEIAWKRAVGAAR